MIYKYHIYERVLAKVKTMIGKICLTFLLGQTMDKRPFIFGAHSEVAGIVLSYASIACSK